MHIQTHFCFSVWFYEELKESAFNAPYSEKVRKTSQTSTNRSSNLSTDSWIDRYIDRYINDKTDLSINTSLWKDESQTFAEKIGECEDDIVQSCLKALRIRQKLTTSDVIDVDKEPGNDFLCELLPFYWRKQFLKTKMFILTDAVVEQNPTVIVTAKPKPNKKATDMATSSSNSKKSDGIEFAKPIAPAKRRRKMKSVTFSETETLQTNKLNDVVKSTKESGRIDLFDLKSCPFSEYIEFSLFTATSSTTLNTETDCNGSINEKTANEAKTNTSNDEKSDAREPKTSRRRRKVNRKSITIHVQKITRSQKVRVSVNRMSVNRLSGRQSINISKRVSINLKPFKCDLIGCKYEGARKAYLTRHMSVHKIIYACKICEKKFTTQKLLTEHEPEHDEKRDRFEGLTGADDGHLQGGDVHEKNSSNYSLAASKCVNVSSDSGTDCNAGNSSKS